MSREKLQGNEYAEAPEATALPKHSAVTGTVQQCQLKADSRRHETFEEAMTT